MQALSRCFYLLLFAGMFSVSSHALAVKSSSVKQITDLRNESRQSAGNKVILLMFSSEGCEYCEFVRNSYLLPLSNNPQYKDTVLVREVLREDYNYIYDFNGNEIGGDTLALRYDIDLTPTIIFMDHRGRELSQRIVGITLLDYLDMYIDKAILESVKKLK